MDRVLLRKMTMKSVIHGGKYDGLTVEQVMQLGKWKVIRMYYYEAKVTFTDEMLAALNIREDERIEKPGVNHEIFQKKIKAATLKKSGVKGLFQQYQIDKRIARRRLAHLEDEENLSKGKMQWQNVNGRY